MFDRILIANRGEIALRLVRAAHDAGARAVAVHAEDDVQSPHVRAADEAVALPGSGPSAYLDGARLLRIACERGCDALHPGYGFLSERADFAQACADAGVRFIGPTVEQLRLFGDKAAARALAGRLHVPVMPGTGQATSLSQARAFLREHATAGIVVKAVAGGGGRGLRVVFDEQALPDAFARAAAEARAAFGVGDLYVERLMARARHIEIQLLGDGHEVISLGERDCSVQRRFQKLVEIAPCPGLPEATRVQLTEAALRLAREVAFEGLGTFEFLLDADEGDLPWVFIEANPRLQVEHTVTEEVTGLDLVRLQIAVAAGARLRDLGLDPLHPPVARGHAVQWRINAEALDAQGTARAASGTLTRFDLPSGPGVRVDTHGFTGATPSPLYDPLLAKLVVRSSDTRFEHAVRRARRVLQECRIEGLATNLALLQALSLRPEFEAGAMHTRFVEAHAHELLAAAPAAPVVSVDPGPEGGQTLRAPMAARVVSVDVAVGERVVAGAPLAVLEAMKMEHVISSERAGTVLAVLCTPGATVADGAPLLVLDVDATQAGAADAAVPADPDAIRPDLQRVLDRHARTLDPLRPEAVAARHAAGRLTARESIALLCDPGSFLEYGALVHALRDAPDGLDALIARTPADGVVTGLCTVHAEAVGEQAARCAVLAYDYTVLAGTQGLRGHQKTDRLFEVAQASRTPVVLFAEGGGGRPGDADVSVVSGLQARTFGALGALAGQVPLVGVAGGRCFAGNAALLGVCDVIIATRDSNIGMGGPAMIEGGGLGRYPAEQVGPAAVQHANGVIDILVDDDTQAAQAARRYLSYFQGAVTGWQASDPRALRAVVPENRLRSYDTRRVLEGLCDTGSLQLLRSGFGVGIHTALARIEGRPLGLIASNPYHLGGAIDTDAADKMARFMRQCNAHGLPLVTLVDTPGFMVGPDIEARAQVRHASRLFVAAGQLRVPCFSVVLRKAYGLGAMAMMAGSSLHPRATLSWPTGEFGPMGFEGAVQLAFRKQIQALPAGPQREAFVQQRVAELYERGSAMNTAAAVEIDAVIDPAQTRHWLARALARWPMPAPGGVGSLDVW